MTSINFTWRALLAPMLLCCAVSARAGMTAWIPLEIQDGQILIPAEVAGSPVKALLVTGGNQNGTSRALVEKLGLDLSGRRYEFRYSSGREYEVPSVDRMPVKLFGVEFELHNVPAHDQGVDLTIGAGFLESFILQIDYPNSRMRLITHDAIDMKKVGNVLLRYEHEFNTPAVQVTLDGGDRWLTLDTSHAGPTLIRRIIAEDEGWIPKYLKETNAVRELLVLPSFKIGPFELTDVPVEVPAPGVQSNVGGFRRQGVDLDSRLRKGVRVSGTIGYEVLRHFVVTIDYEREAMHIATPAEEPKAAAPAPEAAPEQAPQRALGK